MSVDSKYNCRQCSSVRSGWARSGAGRGSQRRQRRLQPRRRSNNISELCTYILAALAVDGNIEYTVKLVTSLWYIVGGYDERIYYKRNLHANG